MIRRTVAVNIDIFELISKYRHHECLWNLQNKDYKNHELKQKVWRRIARHFGIEVSVVKNKVKLLRTAYVSAKRRVERCKQSDGSTKTPNLSYYKHLSFLDNVVICRKGPEEFELDSEKTNDWESERRQINGNCEETNTLDIQKTEVLELDDPLSQTLLQDRSQDSPPAGYGGTIDAFELIAQYKKWECLWNFHNKDYNDKTIKQRAWERIAKYFGHDVNVIKKKVRGMRTTYVTAKRKISMSQNHSPKLSYFNDLKFLDDVVVRRSGPEELKSDISNDCKQTIDFKESDDSESEHLESSDDQNENITKMEINDSQQSSEFSFPQSPPPQQKPIRNKLSTGPLKTQSQQDLKINQAVNKVRTSSLYSSFGTTIALQLQILPLEDATIAMSEIHTMLTTKILEYLKSSSNRQSNQPTYSVTENADDVSDDAKK